MPKYENKNQSYATKNYYPFNKDNAENDSDDVEAANEKWVPTLAVFKAFLVRDAELCRSNLLMLMSARSAPMTIREIKDCALLHSMDVIERQLTNWVASTFVLESKGKYELNQHYRAK